MLPGACQRRKYRLRLLFRCLNAIGIWGTSDVSRCIRARLFIVRTLGFKQCSFHHANRALAGLRLSGFAVSSLSEHAVFPSGFRFQVGSVAQGYHAQPFPCCTGINLRRDAAHLTSASDHRRGGRGGFTIRKRAPKPAARAAASRDKANTAGWIVPVTETAARRTLRGGRETR